MSVAINIRLYEYGLEQDKLSKKRWDNKFFLLKILIYINRKFKKKVDTCQLLLTKRLYEYGHKHFIENKYLSWKFQRGEGVISCNERLWLNSE